MTSKAGVSKSAPKGTETLLVMNCLCAAVVGGFVVFAPQELFALTGTSLAEDPNLLSEIRAPGGVLLLAAAFIGAAAFVRSWQPSALALSALLLLGYAIARAYSIAVDGVPAADLIWALSIEFVLGTLSLSVLLSSLELPKRGAPTPFFCQIRE